MALREMRSRKCWRLPPVEDVDWIGGVNINLDVHMDLTVHDLPDGINDQEFAASLQEYLREYYIYHYKPHFTRVIRKKIKMMVDK